MKPFCKNGSEFVIRGITRVGESHLMLSGIGRYEFFHALWSLRPGVRVGDAVSAVDATKFNYSAALGVFDVILQNEDLFPSFREISIVRIG